jgi:hypothetical protein
VVPGGLRATGTAASVDGPTVRGLPGWVGPAVVGAAALGVCASTAFLNPYAGQAPPCPLHALTGLWCPLCGASRAVYSLTHGDLVAAFARNPLFVIVLPVLLWLWAGWASDALGGPRLWRVRPNRTAVVAVAVVVVAYGVARNLPWPPFRALGPG